MLGSYNDVTEMLYLQKDASGNISVPCTDLTQNQIDGIRFLFTQYKKEKLGVILNYPPGCGNSVQVALFISAISENLKSPVLILYDKDHEKAAWLARFARWTTISEDSIAVDSPNVYLKKQIFVVNIENIGKFYRRPWGVVVVKSDNFETTFKKCPMKVDFKIWITAQDLKKDTELLRRVYTWINPSEQLLHQYLDQKLPAIVKKDTSNEILLDLLLEDILFCRKGLKPFGVDKRKHDPDIPVITVTKKNKDATGKKIKRSKKNEEVPSTPAIRIESVTSLRDNDESFKPSRVFYRNSTSDQVSINNFTINNDRTDKDDEESKMDVESFIRDNAPLKSDVNLNFAIRNVDNTSQASDASSSKGEECTEKALNFASAVADIIRIENDIPIEICEDSVTFNVEVDKDVCDLTQDVTVVEDIEVKDSTGLEQIDFSKPLVQKVFFVSSPKQGSTFVPELNCQETGEAKTEQKSSKRERNGVADQKSKLELSTSVMKETDSSIDSKLKELEERALRKFKGSFLDNIFLK